MGDIWDTLVQPDGEQLRAGFSEAERVGRPHDHWHYSNLVLRDARPARRVGRRPALGGCAARAAAGPPRPDPHDHRLRRRAARDGLLRAAVPRRAASRADAGLQGDEPRRRAGQHRDRPGQVVGLRGRPRPRGALAGHDRGDVPAPGRSPTPTRWTAAMGLGFFLVRTATGRTYVGHDGGIPGHITVGVHPPRERHRRHRADEQHLGPRPGHDRHRPGRPRGRARPGRGRAVAAGDRGARRDRRRSSAGGTPRVGR